MKTYWTALLLLPFLSLETAKSEWEINYLTTAIPETYNADIADLLLRIDSTVVKVLASDTIKRYHYYPGDSDLLKVYHITADAHILIDPRTQQPQESPVEVDPNYQIDWNLCAAGRS